jgi:hypothetical protein
MSTTFRPQLECLEERAVMTNSPLAANAYQVMLYASQVYTALAPGQAPQYHTRAAVGYYLQYEMQVERYMTNLEQLERQYDAYGYDGRQFWGMDGTFHVYDRAIMQEATYWQQHNYGADRVYLQINPSQPQPHQTVTVTVTVPNAPPGTTVVYSVSGSDGYHPSGTLTLDGAGRAQFTIAGAAHGVVDVVTVRVSGTQVQAQVTYAF